MGKDVGGDPDQVHSAAGPLRSAGGTVGSAATALDSTSGRAAGALGEAGSAAAAVTRFGAAVSQAARDIQTQLQALGTLAANGGDDLRTAGGQGRGRVPRAE